MNLVFCSNKNKKKKIRYGGVDAPSPCPLEICGVDIALRMARLDPCPESVMIITHGSRGLAIFQGLGYNGDTSFYEEDCGWFFGWTRNPLDPTDNGIVT